MLPHPAPTATRLRTLVAATLLALTTLTVPSTTSHAAASDTPATSVKVVYSSYNDASTTYRLTTQPSAELTPVSDNQSALPTITVDPSQTYQSWDGFGDSLENTTVYNLQQLSATNRASALDALFNPTTGNNFNLMRLTIGCADFCSAVPNYWTYDDNGGTPDPTLDHFSIQKDIDSGQIDLLRQILDINPRTNFFASMWSPPAWMKTTGSIIGTKTGNCPTDGSQPRVMHGADTGSSVDYYPVLAQYYVKYLQAYAAQGIPIEAVTLQNEPAISMDYPSTCFTPAEQADFAVELASALDAAGLDVRIWGLDDNEQNTFPYSDATLADPAVSDDVDGLGFHNYAGTQLWQPSAVKAQYPDKSMHLTEITNGADRLVEYFRHDISSYTGWATMYQFQPGPGPGYWQSASSTNPDFYTPSLLSLNTSDPEDYDLNGWYYSFGQFSRYIQPGAQRIDSTGTLSGNLSNVAFRNPDGTIVVVAVNRIPTSQNSAVQNTPAVQFRVATPDGQFTDTLPGDTIATYVYTPSTGSTVALSGSTATASAVHSGHTPYQAVDGQTSTVWTSGADQTAGDTFTVDLGSAKTFDQVTLNQGSLPGDSPAAFSISTSTDGTTWSAAGSFTGTTGLTNIPLARQTARYLKLTLTSAAAHWWSIGQLSLYDSELGLLTPSGASASITQSGGDPAYAIDGNPDTRWTTGTAQSAGQSFTLDLGLNQQVNRLALDTGSSSGDHPRGYALTLSTDGDTWTAPVASGSAVGQQTQIDFPTATARYVRVTLTAAASDHWWSIGEIHAYDASPAHKSRTGWTASASLNSTSAADALDSSSSTGWSTGTAQTSGQWFQIDTGSVGRISGVDLSSASTGTAPGSFTVKTSLDAQNWTTVHTGNGLAAETTASWPSLDARYVRVTLTGAYSAGSSWSVTEARLQTQPVTAPAGTSLSHSGWSTDASAAGGDAANAIDGLLNTRWSDGTAQSGNEWFQVDLGSTRTITAVQLIAAGSIDNDEGDYPRGYQVYTSTGDGWTLAASGTPHGNAVTIPLPSTTARYINVHQTGTSANHYWSIAEFNVLQ